MDYKKVTAPTNTITRDMNQLCADTGNVYETVNIIARRANQIAVEMKSELDKKLQEFVMNFSSSALTILATNSFLFNKYG